MKLENDLDTDDIRGLVLRLALPSMLAQFVSVFYSIVDRMYIGNIPKIGETALAGVGICGPIVTLVSSFAILVGVGGAPLMSIRMGQKNENGARQILANCFLMLTVLAMMLTVCVLGLREKLLWWFGAGETTFPYALSYMTIYLCGTFFTLMTTGMNQFIICQGFAKVGMKAVVIGAVANIILDPVFIFGLNLDVRGAALATVLSQMCSCVYVLRFLFGKKVPIRITFHGYDPKLMLQIVKVGFSPFIIIALDNVLVISQNMVIQRLGGPGQGDVLLTCAAIVQSFMLIITMPLGGITSGTQTILGYNYGAKRPDRIWKAERWIVTCCLVFNAVMFLAAQFILEVFVRIFTRNEEYVALSAWAIRVSTLGVLPLAIQYTVVDGFTGMGIAKVAITLSLFRKFIYFASVVAVPVLTRVTNVFYAETISDFAGPVFSTIMFFCMFKRVVGDPKIVGRTEKAG